MIYVDGSSPKEKVYPSAYAVFDRKKMVKSRVFDIRMNVYEIESRALLEGLKLATPYSVVCSDNEQVVAEVNSERTPKNPEFFNNAIELIKEKSLKVVKINRKDNPAGIYLENRLMKLFIEREKISNPKPNSKRKKLKRKKFYLKGRKR